MTANVSPAPDRVSFASSTRRGPIARLDRPAGSRLRAQRGLGSASEGGGRWGLVRDICIFRIFLALLILVIPSTSAAVVSVVETNLAEDRWLQRGQRLEIEFDRAPAVTGSRIAVLVDAVDVSATLDLASSSVEIDSRLLGLQRGPHEVVIYSIVEGDWIELERLPFRVLGRLGLQDASFEPRVDLNLESQLDESHSRDAGEPARTRYADMNGSAGIEAEARFHDVAFGVRGSAVFANRRRDALRFGEEGSDASRIDLADYRIGLTHGGTQLELGHVQFGNHRHLVSNVNRRGVRVRQRIGSWLDVGGTMMSGRRIVGYENFTGLQDGDALLGAVSLGIQPIDVDAFRFRVEGSAMWSEVEQTRSNFNAGEIRDSESSRGVGVTVAGDAWSGRIRYSASWARSAFENEEDPQLFNGIAFPGAKRDTADAYAASLEVQVLRDWELLENRFVSARLTASFEQVEPLYRSLGAFTSADQRQVRAGTQIDLAGLGIRIDHAWSRDNLDRTDGVLVTRTRDFGLGLSLPVVEFLPLDFAYPGWIPTLDYSFRRTDQKAFNGGVVFAPNAIPSQVSTTHNFSADWFIDRFGFGYAFSESVQDNRQIGRREADLRRRSHSISISYQPIESLDLRAGTSFTRQRDFQFGIEETNHFVDGGLTWRFWPSWALSADASFSADSDSENEFESRFHTLSARLTKELAIPLPGMASRTGRIFIAFNRQTNESQDNVAAFETQADTWVLTAGASISLF